MSTHQHIPLHSFQRWIHLYTYKLYDHSMRNKNVDSHRCPLYTKAKRVVLLRKKKKERSWPSLEITFSFYFGRLSRYCFVKYSFIWLCLRRESCMWTRPLTCVTGSMKSARINKSCQPFFYNLVFKFGASPVFPWQLLRIALYNLFMHSSLTNQKRDILLSI